MTRFSEKQYKPRVLIAMALYVGFMLLAWPLVRTTTSTPLKICLALVPVVPMLYVIGLMFRRVRESDELEQRTHLVGLGIATAVVGSLSLIGAFLSAAGVITLDGSELMFVFPITVFCYGITRWWVSRRYGAESSCDDDARVPRYVWFLVTGVIALVAAWLFRPTLDGMREGFLYGAGVGFIGPGLAMAVLRWRRHGQSHE